MTDKQSLEMRQPRRALSVSRIKQCMLVSNMRKKVHLLLLHPHPNGFGYQFLCATLTLPNSILIPLHAPLQLGSYITVTSFQSIHGELKSSFSCLLPRNVIGVLSRFSMRWVRRISNMADFRLRAIRGADSDKSVLTSRFSSPLHSSHRLVTNDPAFAF